MGSFIEINDTLRISKDQGFPAELDILKHLQEPYKLADIQGKVFRFTSKPKVRVYKIPPVRNFLVEDIDGKWLYWGLCHILTIEHDYLKQETCGTFKVTYLNTPEEMKEAFHLIDRVEANNYFNS